jgi:hypothetical protein
MLSTLRQRPVFPVNHPFTAPNSASAITACQRAILPMPADAQSPSLNSAAERGLRACEMKFLVADRLAREIEERLQPHLLPDPHGNPDEGNAYHIRTLYCDTPERAVLQRLGRYRLFKLRLRQYGASPRVFLERKSKRGEVVRKRRTTIPLDQVANIAVGQPDAAWEAGWFHRQLLRNRLVPVCQIEYQRIAYYGSSSEGPLRLTFDRQIRGGLSGTWSLAPLPATEPILPGLVVCEFKFRGMLPALFKSAIEALQLVPRGVSKYRHGIQAFTANRGEVARHA